MGYKVFTDCVEFVGTACKPFVETKKYISTGAVDFDHIIESDVELVDYEGKPSRANLEVSVGDILFAKMQGTKKTLKINEALSNNVYSTGFCAVRAKKDILTERCLYHLLTSRAFLDQKDKNCSGATQKAITNAGLSKINVRIPDYSEQDVLADKLDALTKIINQRRIEIRYLEDLIKARFVEMFGDPVSNEKNWFVKPLLSMGTCKNGMNFHYEDSGVEINCLGVGDFKDYSVITDTQSLPTVSLNEMPSDEYLLKNEDIVFVRSNGNKKMVGRSVAVYPGKTPTTFSGFCIRYRRKDNSVLTSYLLQVLKSDSMRQLMYGRGANIQNLNQQTLSSLNIPVPPLDLQRHYVSFVTQIDKSKFVQAITFLI